MKKRGFEFYSHYLQSRCTVVFYLTDKIWWFKAHSHNNKIMKAGSLLSHFTEKTKGGI